MAGSANFEDTTKPNQSPAAGGFDSERRSSGVSARWLLMQSIKKPSQAIQSLRRFFYAFIKKTFCADPAAYYLRLGRALLGSGVVLGLPSKSDEYSRILHV